MYAQNSKIRVVNRSLTNTIISLHDRGYIEDFLALTIGGKVVIKLGESGDPVITDFQISVINQFFDQLSMKFTYLHAVETSCGLKGIVLSNNVLFTDHSQCVRMENIYDRMIPYRKSSFAYQQAV